MSRFSGKAARPHSIIWSAAIQLVLLAEPLSRALRLQNVPSIIGASLIAAATGFVIFKATFFRRIWARDFLAVLAIGGLAWALLSGDISAIGQIEDLFLPALTSIPNFVAVSLLYLPSNSKWYGDKNE